MFCLFISEKKKKEKQKEQQKLRHRRWLEREDYREKQKEIKINKLKQKLNLK